MKKINKNIRFIILSPEQNFGLVRTTLNSIVSQFANPNIICIVEENSHPDNLKEIEKICKTIKGGDTITSLINEGMKDANDNWNIILFEGSFVSVSSIEKMFLFAKTEKDVIFPIMTDHDKMGKLTKIYNNFVDATLNGLTIHGKTFSQIGNFTNDHLEISKLFWALDAVKIGCQFKGVIGASM